MEAFDTLFIEAGKTGQGGVSERKKTMSSEGPFRPGGKSGCIFDSRDNVQAHARAHAFSVQVISSFREIM